MNWKRDPVLEKEVIQEIAAKLDNAQKARVQIRQISLDHPEITIEDAYGVQRTWMAMKYAQGRVKIGQKIGLTSKVMQRSVGISEPDYGVLLDDMLFHDGAVIPTERFIEPRIEVELAFILAKPLSGPSCTLFDVLNAADFVTPAIEILDSRVQRNDPETKRPRRIMDTISDNAADAGIVLGGRPVRPLSIDLRRIGAVCYQNGQIEETGMAAAVLNHPGNGVAWLANKLHPYGESLSPGQIILSGSFISPLHVAKGHTIHADYGDLGSISCHFG
jgi:2-oxo-hept-3-ene-1,7-dioate hydratase